MKQIQVKGRFKRLFRRGEHGFLLPAVIALGLAVGTVSIMALQNVAQNSVTTNSNYYDALAREATQAGVAMAQSCLQKNITWTAELRPNTNCNGIVQANQPITIGQSDNYTSTFSVPVIPAADKTSTTTVFTVNGTVQQTTPAGNKVGQAYTSTKRVLNRATPSGNVSKNVTSLSVGYHHACAAAEGQAYCWGEGGSGRLGRWNNTSNSNLPVEVDMNPIYTAAFSGTCSVFIVSCIVWADPPRPEHLVSPLIGKTVTKVASGNDHSCALVTTGQIFCWGSNAQGQLGNRSNADSTVPVAVDVQAVDIPAVPASGCMPWPLDTVCSNPYQPLKPKSAIAGKTITDIQAGQYYTCALTSDGDMACWGENAYGQLGVNDRTDRNYPVAIYKSAAIAAVPPSGCLPWPLNSVCSSPGSPAMPATPLYGKTIRQPDVNGNNSGLGKMSNAQHTCVVANDNLPYCWGRNFGGQVGNDVSHARDSNSDSNSGTPPTSCPSNGYPPITTDNDALQPQAVYMGSATATTSGWWWTTTKPASALNSKTVLSISTNSSYTTALGSDNRLYWWGGSSSKSSSSCSCSNKTTEDSNGNKKTVRTCSRTFYRNYHIASRPLGPLYKNSTSTCWLLIFKVGGGLCDSGTSIDQANGRTFQVTSGNSNAGTFCGVSASDMYCQVAGTEGFAGFCSPDFWGYDGQIGDGTTPIGSWCWTSKPQRVYMDGWLLGKSVADIGSGSATDSFLLWNDGGTDGAFTCVLASNQVGCWGNNNAGQLGTGDNSDRNAPTAVSVDSPLGKPGSASAFSETIGF